MTNLSDSGHYKIKSPVDLCKSVITSGLDILFISLDGILERMATKQIFVTIQHLWINHPKNVPQHLNKRKHTLTHSFTHTHCTKTFYPISHGPYLIFIAVPLFNTFLTTFPATVRIYLNNTALHTTRHLFEG